MSAILEDVEIDFILPNFKAKNRKQFLQSLSKALASEIVFPHEKLSDLLISKEIHDGLAKGDGIVVADLQLDHIHKSFTALVILERPIEFNAADNKLVDLICIVLSPSSEGPLHLRRLARVTRLLLKNPEMCNRIREAKDAEIIRSLLMAPDGWMLAA